jgi:hypothetical protein
MAVTMPYYEFREVLSVRDADAAKFRSLADLRGKTVGTLGGTIAYEILLRAEREQHGLHAVSYDDDVHPYSDLVMGRVDAVLLDNVLAERRSAHAGISRIQPQTVAIGHYVGVLARERAAARRINEILRAHARRHARADLPQVGCLERRSAAALRASCWPASRCRRSSARHVVERRDGVANGRRARRYLPSLLRASASRSCCRACRWRWRSRSAC